MIRHSACTRVIASAAAFLAAVTLGAPLALNPALAGDPAARQEVISAYHKLQARSYRMRMTAPDQTVLAEHAAPDSWRMITTITGQPGKIESITVGGETRSRVIGAGAPGTWICSAAGPQPPIALTMNDFDAALEVSRHPDIVIAGSRAHAYELTYTVRGQSAGATTLYVDARTGLARRSVTPSPAGGGSVVTDYYDYGAPISIRLPACGVTG
jgi:hypothetical protein